jgi:hypothetical protein
MSLFRPHISIFSWGGQWNCIRLTGISIYLFEIFSSLCSLFHFALLTPISVLSSVFILKRCIPLVTQFISFISYSVNLLLLLFLLLLLLLIWPSGSFPFVVKLWTYESYKKLVALLWWGDQPSYHLCLHRIIQYRRNGGVNRRLKWDLSPRSQRWSGNRE